METELILINDNQELLTDIEPMFKELGIQYRALTGDAVAAPGGQGRKAVLLANEFHDTNEKTNYIRTKVKEMAHKLKDAGVKQIMVIEKEFDRGGQVNYLVQAVDFYVGINKIGLENLQKILKKYTMTAKPKEELTAGLSHKAKDLFKDALRKIKFAGLKGVFGVYKQKESFLIGLEMSKEAYAIYDGFLQFYPKLIKGKFGNPVILCEDLNRLCYDYFDDLFEDINILHIALTDINELEILYLEYGSFSEKDMLSFNSRNLVYINEIKDILVEALTLMD